MKSTRTTVEIKGFPGYTISEDKKHIIGKWGKTLKPTNNCVILQRNGIRTCVPINKLIWCADRGVSPDEIPKGYSFREVNGKMMAETFSDRMSYAKRKSTTKVKISKEQINYLKEYLDILEKILDDEDGAKAELFTHLNNDKEDYINYAEKLQKKISRGKLEYVVDSAIMTTLDVICKDKVMVANPRGCVRTIIRGNLRKERHIVADSEKIEKQEIYYNYNNDYDYGY